MGSPIVSPVHVVVVEDSLPDVMLVEESLKAQAVDYLLTHFRNGAEAVNALTRESTSLTMPDVIVLDLNIPGMSGLDCLGCLKQHPMLGSIPVIVLTASLQPQEREQAQRLGANRFVNKPIDLYDFLDEVGRALRDMLRCGTC